MVHVLRRRQPREELDRARRPAGGVARELLQHDRGALAAAVGDRVGHIRARADPGRLDRPDRAHAEQVADIGHDPFVAGLDEPVVVEAGRCRPRRARARLRSPPAARAAARPGRHRACGRGRAAACTAVRASGGSWRHLHDCQRRGVDQQQLGRRRGARRRIEARAERGHGVEHGRGGRRTVGVGLQLDQVDRDHARARCGSGSPPRQPSPTGRGRVPRSRSAASSTRRDRCRTSAKR